MGRICMTNWKGVAVMLAASLLLAACGGNAEVSAPVDDETPAELESADTEEDETVDADADDAPVREGPFVPQETLSEDEMADLLFELTISGLSSNTLDEIAASGDSRFIVPLVEAQRFLNANTASRVGEALATLTGESFGLDWGEWMRWITETEPPLPPDYAAWKADQLSLIDPQFRRFIYQDVPATIRLEEVVWGGVRVDGIPALDNPEQIAPEDAEYIEDGELVFGVSFNGDTRAYPLRFMNWHEMFNDVVGGVPVSLAYCTLCGAGILYDTTVDDEVYTFGSSGFLMRSNKLMYDRNTDSLWNQLTGEPVTGELVGSGIQLEILPVTLTTWEDWLSDHPETTVLALNTGFSRPYEVGAAYNDYFASPGTMFPVAGTGDALATKDLVYALTIDGMPKAYALDVLADERVTNDTLAGLEVVLVTNEAPELLTPEPGGAAVRAYERDGRTFSPAPDGSDGTIVDDEGAVWEVTEDALLGPDGESLPRVAGHVAYWFGWFAYFPDTLLYEG